jgi:ribA/ribD-fused uncharacterized protein
VGPVLKIDRFIGEHAYLSNFAPLSIHFEDQTYRTVEHAFQAQKTLDPIGRKYIWEASTPGVAKQRGRRVPLRPGWDGMKVGVMLALVRAKFRQHTHLALMLLETGEAELVESNYWGDRFWGVTTTDGSVIPSGQNWLGRILMHVREELATGQERVLER